MCLKQLQVSFTVILLVGAASPWASEESLALSPPIPIAGESVTAHLTVWLPEPCYDIESQTVATESADHTWDLTLTRQSGACIQVIASVEASATIEEATLGTNTLTVNRHWIRPGGDADDTLTFTFEAVAPAPAEGVVAALLDGRAGPAPCDINGDGRVDVADLVHLLNRRSD